MHPDDTSDLDFYGDPRRCPRHPSVRTTDPLGLHDAPCGQCEYEMEREAEYRAAHGTVHLAAPPVPRASIDDDLPF